MHLPLDRICSLPTILLMIPAFFSSSKLINNEDDKMKEGGGRGLILMNLKFIESYYIATQFTNHFMCNTIFNPEIRKPRLIEVMEFAPVTQVVSTESESHLTQSAHY